MKKKSKNQIPVIPIGLSVCFLGIITFLFLHFTTQNEPAKGTPTPPVDISPTPSEAPAETPDNSYIKFSFTQGDKAINKGSLVLVDKDHRYDLTESDLDLVYVSQVKKTPYMMRPDWVTKLCSSVIEPLDEMMQAYIDEVGENTIYIYIAYRDEAAQQKTLDDFIALLGREAAMRRVALPGYSEHHTGLAMDLGAMVDGIHHSFDNTQQNYHEPTKWFATNAHRFGFILSFPEDRVEEGGTIYEPWHYRYVGYPHSHIMYDNNWSLKEYLDEIRKYTSMNPFKADYVDSYDIFFTTGPEITYKPGGALIGDLTDVGDIVGKIFESLSVSGNNIDGFIVTIKQ